MATGPGSRLGPYEVIALIGEGGMGKVWRAHHTALNRDDALKVLPDAFTSDPERLARFRREAQVLASLNHPNIAHVYGLEQTDGVQALVMELVDGPTLADRIAQGPIPVDEALPIAKQIARALETAHEQGIIHRDLKPANIKLRPDGVVKVLDFGLAKALEPISSVGPGATTSPTITSPAMTQMGVILGTAAYMAPEQARGKAVDKRSDIWAFGCVLYEMLTGKRAFHGEDISDTLAAVLRAEPDWSLLPADLPAPISTLIRGCLEKDTRSRVADLAVVTFVLDHVTHLAPVPSGIGVRPTGRSAASLWRRIAVIAATFVIGAFIAGVTVLLITRPDPPSVVRTTLTTSGATALVVGGADRDIAITPDGSRVIYRANGALMVRPLDQLAATALTGIGAAPRGPFSAPDGQWVGFFDGTTVLKKVATTGGPAVTITRVDGGGPRGATWGPDGTIIYGTIAPATGLQRVSASGGDAAQLTKPDRERGEDHYWPEFLPQGNGVLYTIVPIVGGMESGMETAQVAVLDLSTGVSKVLIRGGSHAHYVSTGHLVYAVAGTLRAVAFDADQLEVTGSPVPVLEGVATTVAGGADVAIAANGSLVYVAGTAGQFSRQTVLSIDRQGRASPLPGIALDSYRDVDVSPDGSQVALATETDIWTYDFAGSILTRLTTAPGPDTRPIWTPDAQRIIFRSDRAGHPELFWRPSDGTGADEKLLTRANDLIDLRGTDWSTDGSHLLFTEVSATVACTIAQMAIDRPSDIRPLVKNEFCNDRGTVSPDGRWLAYESNESGQYQIYIRPFPLVDQGRRQVSTNGGRQPVWSRDGRELYFRGLDGPTMLAVPVGSGATLATGRPEALFKSTIMPIAGGTRSYDVAPDGRFIIISRPPTEGADGPASSLTLILNWTEELKRLVPRN